MWWGQTCRAASGINFTSGHQKILSILIDSILLWGSGLKLGLTLKLKIKRVMIEMHFDISNEGHQIDEEIIFK